MHGPMIETGLHIIQMAAIGVGVWFFGGALIEWWDDRR